MADKGIRAFCDAKFVELLPTREPTRLGNMAFRAAVRIAVIEAFNATDASASTHYNHAFQEARKVPELLALMQEGIPLGRPEDKKGGRKKKVVAEVVAPAPTPEVLATTEEVVATETTEGETVVQEVAAPETPAAAPAEPAKGWPFPDNYGPQAPAATAEVTPAPAKKSKGKKKAATPAAE